VAFRSLLFAPATRPERFARALESGADAVCVDLEDAVPPDRKAEARDAACRFLAGHTDSRVAVGVRINDPISALGQADLAALPPGVAFIMIPKVRATDVVGQVNARRAGATSLWPMVECPEGLRMAWDIAAAPCVTGIVFGAFDYVAEVGCTMEWEPLLFARSQLAAACARARVELLDTPSGVVDDPEGLTASTARARALGLTGRACIHPAQVPTVNAVFTPTDTEVAHARRVIAALDAAGGAAALLDGRLVEAPVAIAARRMLARAKSCQLID
jgi:citrate lyase subunit beta/citryl-CoA lyase/(S)-citramalyl-CoA lyase